MEKDWYDKYGKEFHCADCTFLDSCLNKDTPLHSRCCEQYLRDRIADLEVKLKEKEKERLDTWKDYKYYKNRCLALEKQLAEKKEEIEKLKTTNDRLYKKNTKLENKIVESNIRFYKKGSIEQLEKVKEKFGYKHNSQLVISSKQLVDFIDNEINELKGKVEDVKQ